jgi:hypothetical protein
MRIWKVALAAVVVVALAGFAGRLVMAQSDEDGSRRGPFRNFVARLAENLGITEEALDTAIQDTQLELLDEAVAEGRIDEEHAAKIRERIESGEGFGFGSRHHGRAFRAYHSIGAVAEFLGIERSDVRAGLKDGQTLGEIAAANGSSPEALVDHLYSKVEERLARAVEKQRITQERADEILFNARERITEFVNREPGDFGRFKDEERVPQGAPSPETPPSGAGLFF